MTNEEEQAFLDRLHRVFGANLESLTSLTVEQATPLIHEFCLRDTAKEVIVFEVPEIVTESHTYPATKLTYFV